MGRDEGAIKGRSGGQAALPEGGVLGSVEEADYQHSVRQASKVELVRKASYRCAMKRWADGFELLRISARAIEQSCDPFLKPSGQLRVNLRIPMFGCGEFCCCNW
jgi:hypothetical protein